MADSFDTAEPAPFFGGEPDSSDSLRTFGAVLQALREHAGLSREEFGDRVGFSKHTIASIEQGRRMPDLDLIERAEPLLGGTGALRKAVPHVARRPGLAAWFRRWARMEAHAIALYTYECRLVPGLLQTPAYARSLFEDRLPPFTDDEIEAKLAARIERQLLLTERPNTAFSFVLDEHLFLRGESGSTEAVELINNVLELSRRRNVQVQVMPMTRWIHAGFSGPIQLLETPEHRWFAYLESHDAGQLVVDAKTISALQLRYAKLRSQALNAEDSRGLLERLRGAG